MCKNIVKSFLYIVALISVVSCANNQQESVQILESDDVAAVIGGCTDYYGDYSLFFKVKHKNPCSMTWEDNAGNQFVVNGHMSINFIKPGEYDFVRYNGVRSRYQKFPKAMSIFNKITIKKGEVVYIGNLNVDRYEKRSVFNSLDFLDDQPAAKKYLEKKYPSLVDKMKSLKVTFSKEAIAIRTLMNISK